MGGGTVCGLAARGAAGFFLAAATFAVLGAGTGVSTGGSFGTGTGEGVFGGEARRGKSCRPQETRFPILATAMPVSWHVAGRREI
jgi:hypothetical protein